MNGLASSSSIIATEQLSHLEMVGSMITMLLAHGRPSLRRWRSADLRIRRILRRPSADCLAHVVPSAHASQR
ncbi:hypothetical protein F0Q45_12575 [Mycobacterium simiae]|uniref:Uncharacterized protein n=1 Tax=Mycobacterium simiae TaxID=1784 RepID=A0A5B1BMC5_MYCSI|nr:hypothetical protein F0Q45_12575 [Mycobacterium simiae]